MKNLENRNVIGIKAGIVGIICNLILFTLKLIVGTLSHSFAILADAINNLSDSLSSIITIVGFKIAAKPADKEHPYGHERFEYISGFVISIIMLYLGVDIIKSSVKDLLNPQPMQMSQAMIFVLVSSIIVKIAMALYYSKKAKEVDSDVLVASAKDSQNDVYITGSILLALIVQYYFKVRIDTYLGIIIALFIIYSSVMMLREFMNELLGSRPDGDTLQKVKEILCRNSNIEGYHDLMIHNYGKYHIYGVVHVEVNATLSLIEAHNIIDAIEREIKEETNIDLVIHLDPLDMDSPEILNIQQVIKHYLRDSCAGCTFHDLRIINNVLRFEIVLCDALKHEPDRIKHEITEYLREEGIPYELEITMDTDQLI
ncbi:MULTISPECIES: cation diffusion facilitator family transporter [Erysipelothrix]|uniref:cation diffusion facilitator family transporter n=1 Tax=Erysipelothrix TaxID=1647 RepID=UPI00190CED0A|nr:cation diffusion facilitator family transporter [Erysipelothrix sp. strain 2 (EsS2-6-Brazil)]MBK2402252.1 cation transporter [Erysipelothrix sp. strain 2 (EsS2-6-Brazil)]